MSRESNQTILIWKDVEEFISRRIPLYYEGSTLLSDDARKIVRDALQLWYLVTWDTLSSFGVPLDKSTTYRWIDSIQHVPLLELVEMLKEGSHLLVSGDFPNYDAFKQHLRISFLSAGAILAPVKRIIDRWYRETDTDALNLCYTWFLFLGRLNLPGLTSLEEKALSDYLKIESEIQEDGFSSEESRVLETWFPRSLKDRVFLAEHHNPQHGPGSTADAGRTLASKYELLGHDQKLSMLCRRVYGDDNPYPREPKHLARQVSKTIFVPKSLGSYRTISMESSSTMWHQKGVRSAIMSLIRHRRHYLTRRFQPEYQQPNRLLAWEGSLNGDFATIDLSSASDTVSWYLVKKWFFNTSLYPWLLWTRSTHTLLPNGLEIKLRKYAPMGSDLCFPIETIIFAAIVECAITESGGDPNLSRYRVYGDDIVVEEEYFPAVIRRLIQNGFIPNLGKTFSGAQPKGFFRESCGGFFFDGVDITPIRISRRFDGYSDLSVDTPGRIESLIDLSNECNIRYPSVRRWCVKRLLTLPRHLQPPFSSDGEVGLFSTQPTNFHLLSKESPWLQTVVYSFGSTHMKKPRKLHHQEDIRLFEYLRQTQGRQRLTWPEDRVDVSVSPLSRPSWTSRRSPLY